MTTGVGFIYLVSRNHVRHAGTSNVTLLLFVFVRRHTIGPRQDRERHNVGIEYELLLEQTLQSMGEFSSLCLSFWFIVSSLLKDLVYRTYAIVAGILHGTQYNCKDIPFETEAELRVRGTARTPDILLSCPVGLRVRRREPRNPLYANDNEEGEGTISRQNQSLVDLDDDDNYEWKVICWIDSKVC